MPDIQLNAKSIVTTSATTAPAAGTSEAWTVTALATGIRTLQPGETYALVDATVGATSAQQAEIVKVTACDGAGDTSITVLRGQEGTTPVAHAATSTFNIIVTAGALDGRPFQADVAAVYSAAGGQKGMAAWWAAVANRETAAAKILIMGDSVFDTGATTWANLAPGKFQSYLRSAHPLAFLARYGDGYIPAVSAFTPAPPVTFVDGATGVHTAHTANTDGGMGMKTMGLHGNNSGGSGSVISWGPRYCDRIRIWYTQVDAFGQDGVVLIDGAVITTLTGTNTPFRGGNMWDSGALTPGMHTLTVRGDGTFDFNIEAAEFFNGDWNKGIHVYDGVHFGFSASDFIGTGPDRSHWKAVLNLKPQLVIVSLGINDIVTIPAATYLANMDTILTNIATANAGIDYSVLLVLPYTPSRTSQTDPVWLAYRAGLFARQSHKVAVLDLNASWPVLAADGSTNKGLMLEATDPLHPNDAGHDYLAQILARATSVEFQNPADDLWAADLNLVTEYAGTIQPPAPTSGIRLFSRNRGRPSVAYLNKFGHDTQFQPEFFAHAIRMITTGDGLAATLMAHRCAATSVGTVTEATVATTNFRTLLSRTLFTTSATAGNAGGTRIAKAFLHLNTTANRGGFHYCTRVAVETPQTGSRAFFGLCATTTALVGTTDTSALVNMIGFGWDAADTQLQFMVNDGSGTATKTSVTNAAFSKNGTGVTGAFWELHIYSPPGGGSGGALVVYWYARELSAGAEQSGTVTTTNLPASATLLAPHVHFTNGSTAAVAALGFQSLYVETDN